MPHNEIRNMNLPVAVRQRVSFSFDAMSHKKGKRLHLCAMLLQLEGAPYEQLLQIDCDENHRHKGS